MWTPARVPLQEDLTGSQGGPDRKHADFLLLLLAKVKSQSVGAELFIAVKTDV